MQTFADRLGLWYCELTDNQSLRVIPPHLNHSWKKSKVHNAYWNYHMPTAVSLLQYSVFKPWIDYFHIIIFETIKCRNSGKPLFVPLRVTLNFIPKPRVSPQVYAWNGLYFSRCRTQGLEEGCKYRINSGCNFHNSYLFTDRQQGDLPFFLYWMPFSFTSSAYRLPLIPVWNRGLFHCSRTVGGIDRKDKRIS